MTGIYVRVRRDDQWQSVEIDRLTDAELDAFVLDVMGDGHAWTLADLLKGLAKWVRDHVQDGAETHGQS
jgi:hypothetical protein